MTNDFNLIKRLEELIRNIVQQEIAKAKFWKSIPATVTDVSVDNSLLDVQITGTGDTIEDIPNKTNETVNIGNEVYLLKINNSNSSIVAILKK